MRVSSSLYRVTLMNENDAQPNLPEGAAADVMPDCYQLRSYLRTADGRQSTKTPTSADACNNLTLLGFGLILTELVTLAPFWRPSVSWISGDI